MTRYFFFFLFPLFLFSATALSAITPEIPAQARVKYIFPDCVDLSSLSDIISTEMHHTMGDPERSLTGYRSEDYSWKNPSLNNLTIGDIKLITNTEAYAVGQLGQILKSSDGGLTWSIIPTPFNKYLRAFDIKDNKFIVVGNEGFIAVSSDMGVTWAQPASGVTEDLRDVMFGIEGKIYIAGNSKTMLYSDNSGSTWAQVVIPDSVIHNPHNRTNWNFQSIWVANDTIMMGTGLPGIPIQIVRSVDNGQNWTTTLPEGVAIPPSNTGAYLTGISFAADGLTGYASYWALGINGLAKTTNGGVSWHKLESIQQFVPFPNPEIEYVSDVIYFRYSVAVSQDAQKVITGGSFGQMIASVDGGQTWKEIFGGPLQGHREMRSTVFDAVCISPNGQNWITAGSRGLILHSAGFDVASATVRNGKKLQKVFSDIDFTSSSTGIIAGSIEEHKHTGTTSAFQTFYRGLYLTSSDAGNTWTETAGPPSDNHQWLSIATGTGNKVWMAGVRYVYEYNEDDQLVVIPHGIISFNGGAGQTWTEQITIPGRKITSVKLWNDDHLYATTDGNLFLRSINGQPWEVITLPAPVSATNLAVTIEVLAPQVLLIGGGRNASGGKGFVLRSENAGTNWTLAWDSGSVQGIINQISFVDGRFGYAAGTWGGLFNRRNLLYSSDYGQTWQQATNPADEYLQLYNIVMTDSVSAFLYGHNGYKGIISDGSSLVSAPRFTGHSLTQGYFNGANQLFIIGEAGTVVKYSAVDAPNSAPGKFAAISPVNGESIFIPWDEPAVFSWEESADPDGDTVHYVFILENMEGQELFRSEILTDNQYLATTSNFPTIPPTLYRWRVEAFDTHGLYSTSYPAVAFVDADDYINDQNDILAFSFLQQAFPSVIDNQTHTVEASVIYGTDISNLIPVIEISYNATIDPPSGQPLDFSSPVTFTLTAQNGDQQQWVVTVEIADPIDYITITEFQDFKYSKIPASQFPELSFRTAILNEGHRDVTNVTLYVTINQEQTISSPAINSLPMGQAAVLEFYPPHQLPAPGQYNFLYEIGIAQQNPNLIGNTATAAVELTDTVYATDPGIFSNSVGSNSGPLSIANIYEIINGDNLTSISVGWGGNLPAAPLNFTLSVYRVNMSDLSVQEHIYTSGMHLRMPEMATSVVTFDIDDIYLAPGHYAITINQLTATHIRLAFSNVPGGYFYAYEAANGGSFILIDNPTFGFVILRANFAGMPLSDDASLSDLKVDGQTIEGFDPGIYHYTFDHPASLPVILEVTAQANHPAASVTILPATDIFSDNPADRTTVVKVLAEDGVTESEYFVEFIASTAINDASDLKLNIFPNPARNYLMIESSDPSLQMSIISMDGRLMVNKKLEDLTNRIDVSALPAGVYIVNIVTSSGEVIFRKLHKF
jgi:photosystem II stability/assembly factor-like uncharacterized protein